MKSVRKRLTYANVMSSIAVFLVLGGATAFAAGHLGKNSVGSKQLKNNAVTSAKIKNGAITGLKLAKGAVGASAINTAGLTVPNASHAGTADSAATATSATNATNATTAANATNAAHAAAADSVDGLHLGTLKYTANKNSPKTAIFSANGLTLYAECESAEQLEFTATTSVANAEIYESGNFGETYRGSWSEEFEPGEIELVGKEIGDRSQEQVQGQLVYSNPTGGVVTAQFSLIDDGQGFGDTVGCNIQGTVTY